MAVVGTLMLSATVLFVIMSTRIQARVVMLDEMLVAVGKRVTEMDAALELVGGAQEALKAVAAKQAELVAGQAKVDERLEQVLKNAQDVPEQTAKQVEIRLQALSKQVSALEARLQSQGSSSARMASQLQSMQGALGDASAMKRELEAMARQQRD
jgi:chromosome segregation ATPase